jgi:hypothetical protein
MSKEKGLFITPPFDSCSTMVPFLVAKLDKTYYHVQIYTLVLEAQMV